MLSQDLSDSSDNFYYPEPTFKHMRNNSTHANPIQGYKPRPGHRRTISSTADEILPLLFNPPRIKRVQAEKESLSPDSLRSQSIGPVEDSVDSPSVLGAATTSFKSDECVVPTLEVQEQLGLRVKELEVLNARQLQQLGRLESELRENRALSQEFELKSRDSAEYASKLEASLRHLQEEYRAELTKNSQLQGRLLATRPHTSIPMQRKPITVQYLGRSCIRN